LFRLKCSFVSISWGLLIFGPNNIATNRAKLRNWTFSGDTP
jgi:hypothetical protein